MLFPAEREFKEVSGTVVSVFCQLLFQFRIKPYMESPLAAVDTDHTRRSFFHRMDIFGQGILDSGAALVFLPAFESSQNARFLQCPFRYVLPGVITAYNDMSARAVGCMYPIIMGDADLRARAFPLVSLPRRRRKPSLLRNACTCFGKPEGSTTFLLPPGVFPAWLP